MRTELMDLEVLDLTAVESRVMLCEGEGEIAPGCCCCCCCCCTSGGACEAIEDLA